ncbi:hypothetical protein GCM10027168_45160 [Streptomyces capparidis]
MPHTVPPLDVRWIHGSPPDGPDTDPAVQVYAHDEDTFILRQSKAVHWEAPFLFLLVGSERALLVDTGATESPELFPLRRTVDGLLADRGGLPLLVLHTHPHGDHVAGDGQFADRPLTTVVPAERDAAWAFLGLDRDPDGTGRLDLGGRVIEYLATPGHHRAAVTYHDPRTGFLLTGDTVYPGRLYVEDWAAFTRTVDRLIAFCDTRRVTHLLGCHIEMSTTPGVDYPAGTVHQPDEPPLEMAPERLRAIRRAIEEIGDRPGRHPYPDFVVVRHDG